MTLWLKLAAVAAIIAALWGAEQYIESIGAARERAACTAAVDKLKRTAAADLAAEQAKTRALERGLQTFTDTQNAKDYQNAQTVTNLADRLRRAADPVGRLRDPNAAGCGGSGSGTAPTDASAAADRATDPTLPGGLLSEQLSSLLVERFEQADRINDAYASCRAVAVKVMGVE